MTWAIEFLNVDTTILCLNIERSKHDCLSNVLNTLLVTRIRPNNALALIRVVTRMDTLKSGWTHCVYYTTHQMMRVQVYTTFCFPWTLCWPSLPQTNKSGSKQTCPTVLFSWFLFVSRPRGRLFLPIMWLTVWGWGDPYTYLNPATFDVLYNKHNVSNLTLN